MSATYELVCHREQAPEFTYWATRAEAELASAELAPYSPWCTGCHTIVARITPAPPAPERD